MSLRDADGWTEATDAEVEAEDNALTPYEDALVTLDVARLLLRDRMLKARRATALLARAQEYAIVANRELEEASETCVEAMQNMAVASAT